MSKYSIRSRLLALVLSAVMALPMAVYAVDGTEEGIPAEDVPEVNMNIEMDTEGPAAEEETGEESPEPAESGITAEQETAPEAALDAAVDEPAYLENLSIEENPMGTVEINWDAFEGAVYYEVSSPGVDGGEAVRTEEPTYTAEGLDHGANYDFTLAAFDENDTVLARGAVSIKTEAYKIKFRESAYRVLKSKTLKPKKKLSINLRKLIREPSSGYSVVQGGCTDGKYAYYLMVSSTTQHGRVLKVRIKDNKVIKRSKVLNIWHGNGMAYDSKRKKLVVIAREHRKQEITLIDAGTLRITKQRDAKYKYDINAGSARLSKRYKQSGLAAIAYVKRYDCYIALEREHHNLLIFNPNSFECIGLVYTNLGSGNAGMFQAMDADDKYVYLLLSYYNEGGVVQPYNKIVALDWNSENLLPVVNACKSRDPKFVDHYWYCNNDQNGKPDAEIRIRTKHEAENIYHTTRNGKEHFYLAEYYGHIVYRTVGKRRLGYFKRDNYVYDLGII